MSKISSVRRHMSDSFVCDICRKSINMGESYEEITVKPIRVCRTSFRSRKVYMHTSCYDKKYRRNSNENN